MKVYELITELSKLPAGATVEFVTLMTLDELSTCPVVDEIDGVDNYRKSADIKEVCLDSDTRVVLYS